jgi:cephalosporin hydroxylase
MHATTSSRADVRPSDSAKSALTSVAASMLIRLAGKAAKSLCRNRAPDFRELALSYDQAIKRMSPAPGPLERYFFENTGRLAHKWVHFLPVYDRVLADYRDRPVTMLEVGVAQGGSLEMWRHFFGPSATIYGVDINPDCAERFDPPNEVRIGSQADPAFLRRVVEEAGPPDIILDDGSHVASHQRATFDALFPLLKVGGLYMIEDLHTAYWPNFGGGYRRAGTAIELVKDLIDDQHAWYHGRGERAAPRASIGSIQVFDSIVVIEKAERQRPGHVKTGGGARQ